MMELPHILQEEVEGEVHSGASKEVAVVEPEFPHLKMEVRVPHTLLLLIMKLKLQHPLLGVGSGRMEP